jgi:hypothetical protein
MNGIRRWDLCTVAAVIVASACMALDANLNPENDNLPNIMRPVEHSRTVLPGTGQLKYGKIFDEKSNPENDNLPDIMSPVEHSRTVLPGTGKLEYGQTFEMDGASRDR